MTSIRSKDILLIDDDTTAFQTGSAKTERFELFIQLHHPSGKRVKCFLENENNTQAEREL